MNLTQGTDLRQLQPTCERCSQKFKAKVEKFGYLAQYQAIQNEGFSNNKQILKALKKTKGNLLLSVEYLQNIPQNKERKQPKGDQDGDKLKKCSKKCKALKEDNPELIAQHQQRKNERQSLRRNLKYQKMVQEVPQFAQFNETMKLSGFDEQKKNFKALKKYEGDQDKAAAHLRHKKILQTIELRKTFARGKISKIYLDCNNCFYLESSFLKKSINGNFKEIEEKIATLMKVFQSSYGSYVAMVLVFDNSKLMKDEGNCAKFVSESFKMVNAKPEFSIADDAMVYLASKERVEDQAKILYVTSDRMLQARLIEQNAKNIIQSKQFFNTIQEQFVGAKAYSAIIDA